MDTLPDNVEHELSHVCLNRRGDARQEAHLAILEGRDPALAVHAYDERELRHDHQDSDIPVEIPISFFHREPTRQDALDELHEYIEQLDEPELDDAD